MEEKIKHLEFVQNVITRLNANSIQIKGWMITIVTALLALYASSTNVVYVFVAIVPSLIFWFLDAYYLQQERRFIGLYNDIVSDKIETFSMPIEKYKYDKNDKYSKKYCYFVVLFSKTIWPLYFLVTVGLLIVGIILV